ncbi:hypothetical protein K2P97_06045 [bacterium]|nr:hypothetical protein [bacterium]
MKLFVICSLFGFFANAEIVIPFEKSKWIEINMDKTPPNKVEYKANSINVVVNSSASLLVYKFGEPTDLSSFEVNMNINGKLNATKDAFEEDSYMRFGFVVLGDHQMGTMGKMFAPKWVLQLFELAPEGKGLEKIYFYNMAENKSLIGQERVSPLSKHMLEKVISGREPILKYSLPKPVKTVAIWLNIDGDDTKSKFNTEITGIKVK